MISPEKTNEATASLRDRFARRVDYLRVSVTDRCNFRCMYCMPEEGDPYSAQPELLSVDEFVSIIEVFAARGVRKVRLTGGEPLVRADVPELIERVKGIEGIEHVALTTNGFLLGRVAKRLKEAGLDSLNISLDSLRPERFSKLARVDALERVQRGIEQALEVGLDQIKLNAVIIRGFNDDELIELVEYALSLGVIPRFIEFMPIGQGTIWQDHGVNTCVPAAELRQVLSARWQLEADKRAFGAGPARYWRLHGPGIDESARAVVGIISAVTECFCAGCNRMRLTAQGGLRGCLADDHELDLRKIVRSALPPEQREAAIVAAIATSLGDKKESHSFDLSKPGVTHKSMSAIGG